MKFKTKKQAVNSGFATKICVGYADLQHLLSCKSAVAYTARREGWAADIYDMGGGVAIVTGYAPFGNIKPNYETIRKYDQEARKIRCDYSLTFDQQKDRIHELVEQFVKEVTE